MPLTSSPLSPELIRVGHVLAPFGVQGAARLFVIGDPAQLLALPRFFVQDFGWLRAARVEPHGPGVVVAFVGVADRGQAERLRGKAVFADEAELPPLPEDEFYYHELRGLPVLDLSGRRLGEVVDVQDAGAQDLLVVRHAGGQALVPLQAPYVQLRSAEAAAAPAARRPPVAVLLDAPPGLLGEAGANEP